MVANVAPSSISLWRPLTNVQTEPKIVPRILVYHTMVGYLKSTETMFKRNGFWGTESTWGVGGPWDGAALDGVAYQWQGVLWQADAQFEANAWCNSIETSDGGHYPTPEWSPKQVEKLAQIGAWWCKNTGNDPVIAKSFDGRGLGYHQLFRPWNQASHDCPGPKRVAQFRELIVPRIQKLVDGQPNRPSTPPEDDMPTLDELSKLIDARLAAHDEELLRKLDTRDLGRSGPTHGVAWQSGYGYALHAAEGIDAVLENLGVPHPPGVTAAAADFADDDPTA